MKVALEQRPAFKRVYKKLHANQREATHAAIRQIVADPTIGEAKKGDLAGVFVHKFDCVSQEFLLAQGNRTRQCRKPGKEIVYRQAVMTGACAP